MKAVRFPPVPSDLTGHGQTESESPRRQASHPCSKWTALGFGTALASRSKAWATDWRVSFIVLRFAVRVKVSMPACGGRQGLLLVSLLGYEKVVNTVLSRFWWLPHNNRKLSIARCSAARASRSGTQNTSWIPRYD